MTIFSKSDSCNIVTILQLSLTVIYIFCYYFLHKSIGYIILVLLLTLLTINNLNNRKIKQDQFRLIIIYLTFGVYLICGTAWAIAPHTTLSTSLLTFATILIGISTLNNGSYYINLPRFIFPLSFLETIGVLLPLISPVLYLFIISKIPGDTYVQAVEFLSIGRTSGFTPQTAIAAYYVSLAISIVFCYLTFQSKSKKSNIICISLLVIEYIALILTFKRGHLIASVVATITVLVLNHKISLKTIFKYGFLLGILIAAVAVYLSDIPEIAQSLERLEIQDNGGDMTSGRGELATRALSLFEDNPIFGIGLGGFSVNSIKGTHNVYLQILCETGIVGFLMFIFIMLYNLLYTVKQAKKNTSHAGYINFSIYIQLFFIVYSLVGNCFTDNFIFIMYVLATCLPYSLKSKNSVNHESNNRTLLLSKKVC